MQSVAIGGGSTMDTGKMVGKLLANGGKTRDYQNNPCIGNTVFRPLIALPSTAGTGAELTPYLTCAIEDGKKAVLPIRLLPVRSSTLC